MADGILILKLCFIVGIFSLAMAAGILPSRSKKCSSSPTILGIANSFSGGVFLAIALIHILPEASDDYKEQYGDKSFPLPFLLVFVGYAFILSIDKVAFDSHAAFDHDEH
jgi:zinc transporter 1/2/3